MNESQKKWLLYLQDKGVKFEVFLDAKWYEGAFFVQNSEYYRIPAQPIPDIPGWRELCWEMQSKGVRFEMQDYDREWVKWRNGFSFSTAPITKFRIPQQQLPEWSNEEMAEETKPDPREEIPHRELQIQWHEDMLHHLRTGEPMREWEYMEISKSGENIGWYVLGEKPRWLDYHKYRRKPKMKKVPMWYCLGQNISNPSEFNAFGSMVSRDNLIYQVDKSGYELIGAVTQTEVEIPEDIIPE